MTLVIVLATIGVVLVAPFALGWRRPAPAPLPPDPEPPLTALEAKQIRAVGLCPFCGGHHAGLCRRVEEIWYYPSGGIRHAVLRETWDTSRTIWPEDLPDEN